MPRFDQTGPPSGSRGPRDGRGRGQGWAPGTGVGLMAGGQRGILDKWKLKRKKKKK